MKSESRRRFLKATGFASSAFLLSRNSWAGSLPLLDAPSNERPADYVLHIKAAPIEIAPKQEVEIDFVADNPGLTLFHCHHQLHMDFGFMILFDYI